MTCDSVCGSRMALFLGVACVCGVAFAAQPVWPRGEENAMNGFYRFRAAVSVPTNAAAVLRATAGYTYRACVNGRFVGYGPARSVPGWFRLDEWPLALTAGTNVVELDVAGYNCNNFYLPGQMPFVQAEIVSDGRVLAQTARDGAFAAYPAGRVTKVPRFCYQRGFAEIYRLPETRRDALPLAEQPAKKLLPRQWAYPDFALTPPFAAVSAERVRRDDAAKVRTDRCLVKSQPGYKIFPLEELEENPHYDLQRLKVVSRTKCAASADGWYALSPNAGIVFEAPREYAGFPRLRAKCRENVTLYFCFDEFLQPDGSVDNFRAETLGAVVWHLAPGEYDLEGFEPVALKCARLVAIGGALQVTAPSVRSYVSPTAWRATFRASDPAYAKIFDAAKASYVANAVDCLTDCPIRERAGWLGDTFFTARASQWLTGSGRNERLFLDNFLRPESFDCAPIFKGFIPAVWPVDLMSNACFIPNYDMWFLLQLEDYVRRTGDEALAESFRPRVMTMLTALDRYCNADGLLEKLPGWVFVEWSRANALVQDVNYPSNMMYAETLDAAARLYARSDLAKRAANMRVTIRNQSRVADGWYCDNAVRQKDGSLKLSGERTETCQYYAFFTGVATKERDAVLWNRLVRDFGPERIRTAKWDCGDNLWARLSTPIREGVWKEIWPANMIFGTCLRMELLSRDGRSAQVAREMKEHFLPMAEKTGTLWEHGDPRASCCHGFAAIAAEYLYRDVLGVRGIDAAQKTITVSPSADLPLEWCEGSLPLPDGALAVIRWRKVNGVHKVETELPTPWRQTEKEPFLSFTRVAKRRFVLDNEIPLASLAPSSPVSANGLRVVGGYCPAAHYRMRVTSLPASIVFVDAAEREVMRFSPEGKNLPTLPFDYSVLLTGSHSPATFVTKDGTTRLLKIAHVPDGVDPRIAAHRDAWRFCVSANVREATASLSAGIGQADVRFVTRGRENAPYVENGRFYFTFSARGYGAYQGVASLDPNRFDPKLEGIILFDYGDGLLRNDVACHLFYDDVARQWRGWSSNFSTCRTIKNGLSARAEGGLNAIWSAACPLRGISVMKAKSLGLTGMNEDPCGTWDAAAGKWRLLVSQFVTKPQRGIRAAMLEAAAWDGPYRQIAGPIDRDSTGTTIFGRNGTRYCLFGSADRACYVYSYPDLKPIGTLGFDCPPWNAYHPNGRVWPCVAAFPDAPNRHFLLTMDRLNFPGMPTPNWTYGGLWFYHERVCEK